MMQFTYARQMSWWIGSITNILLQVISQCLLSLRCTLAQEHQKESDDNAEGLQPKILLMEGAKVMFTRNLLTAQGLTNGTMGVIGTNPFDCF